MPLRLKKIWLSLGWLLILAIIILSLIPPPGHLPSYPHLDKLYHFIAYFSLMLWFAQIDHTPSIRLKYMTAFILLGIGLEILQGLSPLRNTDGLDALVNILAVLSAWRLTQHRFSHGLTQLERLFFISR